MLAFLVERGPKRGYYPSAAKSWHTCEGEDEEVAKAAFDECGLDTQFTRGHVCLGGFIGSGETKRAWIDEKVKEWTSAVRMLAKAARKHPQAARAAFTFCLQGEWQYASRVVSDVAPHLAPIERAIRNEFLPALFDIGSEDIDAQLREILSHSVKKGGLGACNPVDSAPCSSDTSKKATNELVKSVLDDTRFDLVR